jgi:pimeloyl-ACP methyl ester carboxylesterase
LIGLAERAGEASLRTGLVTHVEQITELIVAADLYDLALVGHRYGGLVMVGAAERVQSHLRHLVYLDALVPDHGQSAFNLMPGVESDFVRAMRSAGSEFLVPPMSAQDLGVTEPADVEWMKSNLTPMPILTHREKVDAPLRKAFKIPSTYIHCQQFGLGARFAAQARHDGCRVLEADAGHDVMLTHPERLADLLEQST